MKTHVLLWIAVLGLGLPGLILAQVGLKPKPLTPPDLKPPTAPANPGDRQIDRPELGFDLVPGPIPGLRDLSEIERFLREKTPPPAPVVVPGFARPAVEIQGRGQVVVSRGTVDVGGEEPPLEYDPAGPHQLEFADGNSLRGTLAAVDSERQEVLWRRVDASAPFLLPLAEISRLILGRNVKLGGKASVTVKLAAGDWVTAEQVTLEAGKVQLRTPGGTQFTIDRANVEWIYFAEDEAPECYEGPTSMAGFTSMGGWSFRDGALRSKVPGIIGRSFGVQADQVEYLFEISHGRGPRTFRLTFGSRLSPNSSFEAGNVQFRFQNDQVQMLARSAGDLKMENATVPPVGSTEPEGRGLKAESQSVQYRIFHDRRTGRIVLFVDDRKVADWMSGSIATGLDTSFNYQPLSWNPEIEQSISKIRVMPWDGRVPELGAPPGGLLGPEGATLMGREFKSGTIESLVADALRLKTPGGALRIGREKLRMLRFEHAPARAAAAIVARVRLTHRGEVDAHQLTFRNDKLVAQTASLGEVALPLSAIEAIDLVGTRWTAANSGEVLVFANGDQLAGALDSLSDPTGVQWRSTKSEPPVTVQTAALAGVRRASPSPPATKQGVAARFRNGDLLFGELVRLDGQDLVLKNAAAGVVTIGREKLQTLYFGKDGLPLITHGAVEPELWQAGVAGIRVLPGMDVIRQVPAAATSSMWRYFDGTFTRLRRERDTAASNVVATASIGRFFETMPDRVEFGFDVQFENSLASGASAHLLFDPGSSGIMLRFNQNSAHAYDQGARQGPRGITPVEFRLGQGDVPWQHRVRVLADRAAGRVTILLDGRVAARFTRKASDRPRNYGRSVLLTCDGGAGVRAFSELWMAPWNGRGVDEVDTPNHSLVLNNGDETQGTVTSITPEVALFTSEVGLLELPTDRLSILDLGGHARPTQRVKEGRARLTDNSALTVKAYRVEGSMVQCDTELAGELRFPLHALQELAFASHSVPKGKSESK